MDDNIVNEATSEETTSEEAIEQASEEIEASGEQAEENQETPIVENGEVPVEDIYEPNYGFSAYGKDYQFDEWAQGLVNKENEEHFRDLYSKAYGLDEMKTRYNTQEQELANVRDGANKISTHYEELSHLFENDFDGYLKKVGAEKKVWEWVENQLAMENMTDQQKAVYQQKQDLASSNFELQKELKELQQFKSNYEQQENQKAVNEVIGVLNDEKHVTIVNEYDAQMGYPGAFAEEMVAVANQVYQRTSQSLTPAEAMDLTLKKLNRAPASQPTQENLQASQPQDTKNLVAEPKVTIPNVTGAGAPIQKRLSVRELREKAKSM